MMVSIFALGPIIPLLITRDLACNAIVIYSSKAVSRGRLSAGQIRHRLWFSRADLARPGVRRVVPGKPARAGLDFFLARARRAAEHFDLRVSSMAVLSLLAWAFPPSARRRRPRRLLVPLVDFGGS
jgi:hypothetical protein